MKTKILHLITDLESGGAQIQLINTLKKIDKNSFEIYVAFLLGNGSLSPQLREIGIKVYDLTDQGKFTFSAISKLYVILRKLGINILHTHLVHASLLGRAVARLAGVKYVLSTRHYGYDTKENNWSFYLERMTCHIDNAVIAVSSAVKQYIQDRNVKVSGKIRVIPNGVEVSNPISKRGKLQAQHKFRIVSVGRLHRIKRFDVLIKAAQLLKKQIEGIEILIVGEGEQRSELEKLISQLGQKESIKLIGNRTNAEVVALMNQSDLYIQCSDWEGFGLAVAEAMAQGLPVIATKVGGLTELVDSGFSGILIPPSDPSALANEVVKLARNEASRNQMGFNATETIKSKFNIANSVKSLEQLYSDLYKGEVSRPESNENRIRVVQIITRLNTGGAARHVILLASRLDKQQFDCLLITGKEYESEGNMSHLARNSHIAHVPALQRNISLISDLRAFWAIYRILKRFKPTIVHCHTSKAGILGRTAARLAGVPVTIYTFHGHIFGDFFSPFLTNIFKYIERSMSIITTRIIAISKIINDDLVELGIVNGNGSIIENGFDLDKYVEAGKGGETFRHQLGLNQNHIVIGAVARFVPTKGCEYLLDAAPEFLGLSSKLRLVLVGDGELKEKLQQRVSELGIEDRVIFTGFKDEMVEVYSAFDVFVLSSIREGMPTVVLEAICSGLPVVATCVDAVPELITPETGILVAPKDSKALAEAIREVVDRLPWNLDDSVRSRFRDRFSSARLIRDMESLYRDLLTTNTW